MKFNVRDIYNIVSIAKYYLNKIETRMFITNTSKLYL